MRQHQPRHEPHAWPVGLEPQADAQLLPEGGPADVIEVIDEAALFRDELDVFRVLAEVSHFVCEAVGGFLEDGVAGAADPGRLAGFKAVAVDLLPCGTAQKRQQTGDGREKQTAKPPCFSSPALLLAPCHAHGSFGKARV